MRDLIVMIDRNPGKFFIAAIIVCITLLHATNSVATIEVIDGKEYITAIDGKEVMPRSPNRTDVELIWEYKEVK
jgi:hypothetical protein